MATLERDGYQVVSRVIPDYAEVRDQLWRELMELCPGFDPRADASRDQRRGLYALTPLHSMLYQHYVGHLQTVWNLRQRPEVVDVFADIWNTRELYVSFDGLSALVPPESTGRGFQMARTADWLHADQRPGTVGVPTCPYRGRLGVQGYVNLYDAGPQDATLGVIPGSHLEDRSSMSAKGDWLLLPGRQSEVVRVEAKAGDMVLWDSRTAHQGTLPIRGRPPTPEATSGGLGMMAGYDHAPRLVVYVCMLPRARLTAGDVKKRAKAFEPVDGPRRMTNHWGTKLFPKAPRLYGGAPPILGMVAAPVLTDLGRSLL